MTDCIRCNGNGIINIRGDEDTLCPVCQGTGNQPRTDDQHRALFAAYGWPSFAKLEELCNYDRRIGEELWYALTHPVLDYDVEEAELDVVAEDALETEDSKYREVWGE